MKFIYLIEKEENVSPVDGVIVYKDDRISSCLG
jgi:hypothetical protein